jgi:cell shape-determining protein MreD
MTILAAIPVLGLLIILQTAIASRIPLLQGTADLVLLALVAWAVQERVKTTWQWGLVGGLMVSLVSALSLLAAVPAYLLSAGLARALRKQLWQMPLLAMFSAVFLGTLIIHAFTFIFLRTGGVQIPFWEAFNNITLPSALLNLLLAVPVYALMGDLANRLYPEEIEM